MKTLARSDKARHLLLRASDGERLPDALLVLLAQEGVACGWLRASGVLRDVEIRAFDASSGALGETRRIAGPVQALAIEGAIGHIGGEPSLSMRAILARETDRGLETIAGEIVAAGALALEAIATSLDDASIERALDASAGIWLLGGAAAAPTRAAAHPQAAPRAAATPAWSAALEASTAEAAEEPSPRPVASPTATAAPMPRRPSRPGIDLDAPSPEPGDVVDHFAFGRCDVLRSDGDRLHLKVHKDGRIREIALEMLRVTPLETTGEGKRHFKLERRM